MKCPWKITTKETAINNNSSKIITHEFGECYGDECPFLRYTTNGFDRVGFQKAKEYCARAIVEERR